MWPCFLAPTALAVGVAAAVWMVCARLESPSSPRRVLSIAGFVLGVVAVALGAAPFGGYVGMFFAPAALLAVYFGSGMVDFERGVQDWPLFSVCSLGGNVAIGWCLGALVELVRRVFRSS